jgi:hypothetical protein
LIGLSPEKEMNMINQSQPSTPENPEVELRRRTQRAMLLTQFVFYRRLVAKKHSFNEWFEIEPSHMTDSELEQAVAFLKDAAHLPPG